MNTLSSAVPTTHQVVPSSSILPLSLISPRAPQVGCSDLEETPSLYGHTCFELVFLEEGEGWHQIGNQEIRVRSGDLLLATVNEVNNLTSPEGTRSWAVIFEADILTPSRTNTDVALRFLDELPLLSSLGADNTEIYHFQVASVDQLRWLTRLQQMERELNDKPPGFGEAARTLLILLLIDTARLAANQLGKRSLESHPLLTKVFQFIEHHYRNQIGLYDVAKAVSRSPAYLTDFVRRETGKTVLNWIIERRLAEARRLLLMTNLSVEQIAEAVGYLDTSHFIRQFRRLHEMTPRAWGNIHQS